jgi:putative ABC transport system ATP-binding protein
VSHPMLEARGVGKVMRSGGAPLTILRDISFTVPAGQFLAIVGASGSGKSTLLGLLAGLDDTTSGSVFLDGQEISGLSEDALARLRGQKVGFVFQSYQLLSTLTALENVLLPYDLNASGSGVERARSLLSSVGLADRAHHYPVQLSGGEQQRVALARSFIMQPRLVLCDEPTGNLDSRNGSQVLDMLLDLNRREGTTLVVVTHDAGIAAHADRCITLRDGAIVSDVQASADTESNEAQSPAAMG